MAIISSIPARKIPWTEELGRPQSMGSQRLGHNWPTNTHTHTHTHRVSINRIEPTQVFFWHPQWLLGESREKSLRIAALVNLKGKGWNWSAFFGLRWVSWRERGSAFPTLGKQQRLVWPTSLARSGWWQDLRRLNTKP